MKLYKALKVRKNLIGEITKLKHQIKEKNSYLEGSKNGENFDAEKAYELLLSKIQELTSLKFIINEANREIQAKIYLLGEYKALISFWNEVSVVDGTQVAGYSDKVLTYSVNFTESTKEERINEYQKKVDAIQEELDEYNFSTDIPWGDMTEGELQTLEDNVAAQEDADGKEKE